MAGVAGVLLEQVAEQPAQPRVVAVAVVDVRDEVEAALGERRLDPPGVADDRLVEDGVHLLGGEAPRSSNSHSSVSSWPSERPRLDELLAAQLGRRGSSPRPAPGGSSSPPRDRGDDGMRCRSPASSRPSAFHRSGRAHPAQRAGEVLGLGAVDRRLPRRGDPDVGGLVAGHDRDASAGSRTSRLPDRGIRVPHGGLDRSGTAGSRLAGCDDSESPSSLPLPWLSPSPRRRPRPPRRQTDTATGEAQPVRRRLDREGRRRRPELPRPGGREQEGGLGHRREPHRRRSGARLPHDRPRRDVDRRQPRPTPQVCPSATSRSTARSPTSWRSVPARPRGSTAPPTAARRGPRPSATPTRTRSTTAWRSTPAAARASR